MLSLKTIFFFCEPTIFWRKMQITEQLTLNEFSQIKEYKAKANTHVVLYYKYWSKKRQWNTKPITHGILYNR